MISYLSNLIGIVQVKEEKGRIEITGIDAHALAKDIDTRWKTTRFTKNAFNVIGRSKLTFYSFFAIEIDFILTELIKFKRTRTPRRSLVKIQEALREKTWIKDIAEEKEKGNICDLARLNDLNVNLFNYQEDFINHFNRVVPLYNLKGYILGAEPGTGKAQPLSAKIKTPYGWSLMGSMRVGMIVSTPDGNTAKVTGVFPQGERPVYLITLRDGRQTEADINHIWKATYKDDLCLEDNGYQLYTTEDILRLKELTGDYPYLPTIQRSKTLNTLKERRFFRTRTKAESHVEYIRSLGGIAVIHQGINNQNNEDYYVEITNDDKIQIKSIEYIGEIKTQCISIDHPEHLYITDDYIVTHNTITSLALAHTSHVDTVIVISPLNAVNDVWESTISRIYKKPMRVWTSMQKGEVPKNMTHYVFHYEALEKAKEFVNKNQAKLGKVFIILDESHNLNESGRMFSKRTQSFIDLCSLDCVKYVLWQSGTIFKAMGNEIIPCFMTIDPLFTPMVVERFRPIYGVNADRAKDILAHRIGLLVYRVNSVVSDPVITEFSAPLPNGKEYTLAKVGEEMRAFINERIHYYKANMDQYTKTYFELIEKAKVKGNIPPNMLKDYLEKTASMHKGYDPLVHKGVPQYCNDFEEKFILPNLSNSDKHVFRDCRSVYKYYLLKVQGEALGRILSRTRIKCVADLALVKEPFTSKTDKTLKMTINEMIDTSQSKTVIFSNYVKVVDELAESLRERGYDPIVMHGEHTKDLLPALREFEKDPRKNPLITTFKSLSTAVPLVSASTTIMIDQPFRDYVRAQAIARTNRIGQKYTVDIYDLFLDTGNEDNLSTRSNDILEWSKEQVEAIMGRTLAHTASIESYTDIEVPSEMLVTDIGDLPEDVKEDANMVSQESLFTNKIFNW